MTYWLSTAAMALVPLVAMLDWILSEEGQQLIEQSGYVGI